MGSTTGGVDSGVKGINSDVSILWLVINKKKERTHHFSEAFKGWGQGFAAPTHPSLSPSFAIS